jgi:hypothetical protein
LGLISEVIELALREDCGNEKEKEEGATFQSIVEEGQSQMCLFASSFKIFRHTNGLFRSKNGCTPPGTSMWYIE